MLKTNCRLAGLIYLIHDKANRGQPLSTRQCHRNRQKSSLRAKVEFPFHIIKRLWGPATRRYRGLAKNTARLHLLFALSSLYQVRQTLLAAAGSFCALQKISSPSHTPSSAGSFPEAPRGRYLKHTSTPAPSRNSTPPTASARPTSAASSPIWKPPIKEAEKFIRELKAEG